MSGDVVRVGLVDDQQLVRAGFRMVIDSQPDLMVVAEASDGLEALHVLAQTPTDVVLMDVRMPRLDGIETTRRLTALPGAPRVVVLTTFDLDEYVLAAIGAGASGFLLKDAPPEEMLAAVRTVHAGDAVIAASSTRRLLQHLGPLLATDWDALVPPTDDPAPHEPDAGEPGEPRAGLDAHRAVTADRLAELTPREREVLQLMARGLSNTEIAGHLTLAEATVKTHVGRVLAKTGCRDRVQAVVLAYAIGEVCPDDLLLQAAPHG